MIDQTGGRKASKPVDHFKYNHWCSPGSLYYYTILGVVHEVSGPNCVVNDYGYPVEFDKDSVSTVYPRTEDQQINDALDRFYNLNDTDNVLNLVEGHQTLSLLRGLFEFTKTNKVQAAKEFLLNLPDVLRNGKKKMGKSLASKYLAYSFGVAPLMSDIYAITSSVKDLQSRLRQHRAGAGKEITVRSRLNGDFTGALSGRIGSSHYNASFTPVGSPYRIVSVRGTRWDAYSSKAFSDADYLMSRFGGTGPISLAWELVPYSFVVDWFVDLRGVCNALDNLVTGSTKNVTDVCVSEKRSWNYAALWTDEYASGKFTGPGSSQNGRAVYGSELVRYTRKPVSPSFRLASSGRFGKKQLSLLAALILQNWKAKRVKFS
jgi:hypothetical protein